MLDKTRSSLQSKHPEVVAARGKVEKARLGVPREPTVERRGILNEAKQLLFSTIDRIKEYELMEKVQRVQAAHGQRQYGEAWKVINEMTGRQRTKEGQVGGHSPEEKVATWYNNFRKVVKKCGLDNIFLEFCNLALLGNKLADMWSLQHRPGAQIWGPLKTRQLPRHQPDVYRCKGPMTKILKAYGVPPNLLRAIETM